MNYHEKIGLTIVGAWAVAGLAVIAFWGGVIYIALHFLHKIW